MTGISNITADGDTALYDALYEGVANAGNRTGSNCVIAFTDGIENSSSHTLDEVISLATEKAVPIYLIGSSESDLDTLQQIADETKGYLWDISSISDMGEVLEKINSRQKIFTLSNTLPTPRQTLMQNGLFRHCLVMLMISRWELLKTGLPLLRLNVLA